MALFDSGPQTKRPRPVVLISMDGVGIAPPGPGNAVSLAKTPNLDKYWQNYAHGMLQASGLYVGLPANTDGNSEVGHMTMGAGKVILQDKPRIDNAIRTNTFESNPVLVKAFEEAEKNNTCVHLMGLIGSGHVHSSLEHLLALITMAENRKFPADKLLIHAFTDGRDSTKNAGIELLERVEGFCLQKGVGRIASIIGRAYAMDRNRNWARTAKGYDMLTLSKGAVVDNWKDYMNASYQKGVFDEYIEPAVVVKTEDRIPARVQDGDSVIFFNFRQDRALQLSMMFEIQDFKYFQRQVFPRVWFAGMTDYGKGHPKNIAFPVEDITNPLGKVIGDNHFTQLRIAESEKFPHVTYFFNGGNGNVSDTECWIEIPSPKGVASYDEVPPMSQREMTDMIIQQINTERFDFIMTNFAGPDMVAHTGMIGPAIESMEICDACIGQIVDAVLQKDGVVVITADHGNIEEMINLQTGEPDTKHSTNEVPVLIIGNHIQVTEIAMGGLADVAPTVLTLMGIGVPAEMTGRSLIY